MKIGHTFYEQKGFGGSETFFTVLKNNSKHKHEARYVARNLQYRETFDNFYNGFSELIRRIADSEFDVVHNHFFLPARFCAERGIPSMFTSHCMLSQEFKLSIPDTDTPKERDRIIESYNLFDASERVAYKNLKNVYVFSDFHRREIESIGGKATKIPILMDTEIFGKLEKQQARKELDIPDKFTLLFLGRPTHYKGLGILLDSLKFLSDDPRLVLLSEGVFLRGGRLFYSPCIRTNPRVKEIKPNFLSNQITIRKATSRSEISKYYSAADILVCPSLYESVGYVNLEAMASRLPIVASNTCGIPEFVINNQTGLLFETGNPKDLAEKVERLRKDSELVREITENQKEFISRFDARNNISVIDKLYGGIK